MSKFFRHLVAICQSNCCLPKAGPGFEPGSRSDSRPSLLVRVLSRLRLTDQVVDDHITQAGP